MDDKLKEMVELAKFSGKQSKMYPQLVEALIREKYTISQELAINRQRDTKPTQFEEYNSYCEECKAEAKKLLGM